MTSIGLKSTNAIRIRRDLNGWIESELSSHHTFVTVVLGGGVYGRTLDLNAAERRGEASAEGSAEGRAERGAEGRGEGSAEGRGEANTDKGAEASTDRNAEASTESPLRRLRGSINVRARLRLFEYIGVVSGSEAQRLWNARGVLAELGSEDGWWRGLTRTMLAEGAWDARGMRVAVGERSEGIHDTQELEQHTQEDRTRLTLLRGWA